jgi:heat shock protein HtpX
MATLYTHRSANIFRTWFLMAIFLCLIIAIGYFVSIQWGEPVILYVAVGLSLVLNITSYWFSDKIALSASGAKEASESEHRELHRILENLAITAGIKKPRLYIINDPAPNAFATGRNQENAAVAVTTGLVSMLDRSELEGVLAHELAHIGNKDILLQSVVVVLVGTVALVSDILMRVSLHGGGNRDNKHPILLVIGLVFLVLSPIVAMLLQLAISRKREFLADATGALITRYPDGLAGALEKISSYHHPLQKANKATAHLFFASPFGGDQDNDGVLDKHQKTGFFTKIFMTHPPVEERIAALKGMK